MENHLGCANNLVALWLSHPTSKNYVLARPSIDVGGCNPARCIQAIQSRGRHLWLWPFALRPLCGYRRRAKNHELVFVFLGKGAKGCRICRNSRSTFKTIMNYNLAVLQGPEDFYISTRFFGLHRQNL